MAQCLLTLTFASCLTIEPMDRFQSVLHENNLEFPRESNGEMSDSPRVSLKKLRPKLFWHVQDLNLGPWCLQQV